ncbi:MAG TPA: hypothetical protein VHE12_09355 [bacterium]|nr:hypothetical protein [bacterium]
MKFSRISAAILLGLVFLAGTNFSHAQSQWMDSILPPDHLLENLPWLDDEGKIQSKGLFDFENVRGLKNKEGDEIKDLILIYRPNAPADELDKPHNQTLNVCFYNPETKKYEKNFQDEGGTIQWIRVLKTPQRAAPYLIFQRDDLKGGQVLKGFSYINGAMKQVLDLAAPQIFTKFEGLEIWCSSKGYAKDRTDAELILAWEPTKEKFLTTKSGVAGWTGTSILVAEAPATPTPGNKGTEVVSKPAAKTSKPSADGWWDDPLDPQAAMLKLKNELIPALIKGNQIAVLGQKAKIFFAALEKQGTPAKDISGMRSSYYASVASVLADMGKKKDAAYYLKIALGFQKDNPDAMAVQAKLK